MRSEAREDRQLLQRLDKVGCIRRADGGKLLVQLHHLVASLEELGVLDVEHRGEDARRRLVRLDDDVLVELRRLQAHRLVERTALVVVEVHRHVDAEAEEAAPQLALPGVEELRLRLEERGEEVSVPRLVLAPVLEVLEHGVQLAVGVALQVAVDGDVSPVSDLLAEVRGVEDELGLEEGVLAVLREKAEVECKVKVAERLVEESGVACLVAGHEREHLGDHGVDLLQAASELLVEEKSAELRRAASLEELDEDLARGTLDLVRGGTERVVANEVALVVVLLELLEHSLHFLLVQLAVPLASEQLLHLLEILRLF